MKDKDFIKAIIDLYQSSRLLTYKVDNIRRCKNRPISGLSEDLLALCISKFTNNKTDILIEPEISLKGLGKKICPDVCLSKGKVIGQLWDIKMDLGHSRDTFMAFCNEKGRLIAKIRNGNAKMEGKEFTFSSELTYNIVVVSDTNGFDKKLIPKAKKIKNINVFFLTTGVHPNDKKIPAKEVLDAVTSTGDYKSFIETIEKGW